MALWNPKYYKDFINGNKLPIARKQKVYSLDFKSPVILCKKVEELHYERGLGLCLIDEQELTRVKKEHLLSRIESIGDVDSGEILDKQKYLIDIENTFTALETSGCYEQLLKTVKFGKIDTLEEKTYLAIFIVIHQLRSKKFLDFLCHQNKDKVNPKLEAILQLDKMISNPDFLYNKVHEIIGSEFLLYSVKEFMFPLTDNPIIYYKNHLWATLSPAHLLVINTFTKSNEIRYLNKITKSAYRDLCNQIILNAGQSIIFCKQEWLEDIRDTDNWKARKIQVSMHG